MLQIGGDGAPRSCQFPLIVAIAFARIRADPLARVDLQRCGAGADHLPSLASSVAGGTDRLESPVGWGQLSTAGQRTLSRGLARRIDVKDNMAAPLSIKDAPNGFRCPPLCEALLFKERAERF